jgi:membrane protein DedA with SNARE-associated domain
LLTELLHRYGYVVILLGTLVEGETILLMGGFAAHQGYLELPWVMLAAFVGSLSGDQLAFFAGRHYGPRLLERFPRLRKGVEHGRSLLLRRGTLLLLGFRFVYGIRNVTPLAAGLSEVPVARFVTLNALGAALWSVSVGSAGYAFGRGFALLVERARHFEEIALAVMALAGLAFAALRCFGRRMKRHPSAV